MAPCAPSGNICNPNLIWRKAESHLTNSVAEPLPISPTLVRPPVMATVSSRVTVICSHPAPHCSAQSNWALQCQTQSLSMVLKSQHYFFQVKLCKFKVSKANSVAEINIQNLTPGKCGCTQWLAHCCQRKRRLRAVGLTVSSQQCQRYKIIPKYARSWCSLKFYEPLT